MTKKKIIEDPNKNDELVEVLSINLALEKKYGADRRLPLVKDVFRGSEAHIISLQEVAYYYQAKIERMKLDFKWKFGWKSGDLLNNPIGVNIKRFIIEKAWTIGLSHNKKLIPDWDAVTPRGASFIIIRDLVTKRRALKVNFHLDNISVPARIKAVQLIQKEIEIYTENDSELGVLLSGDMNTSPHSTHSIWHTPEYRAPYVFLTDHYKDAWCEGNPKNAIRPTMYHAFKGDQYVVDEYGTKDTDFQGCSEHFEVVACSLVKHEVAGVRFTDHFGLDGLYRYK